MLPMTIDDIFLPKVYIIRFLTKCIQQLYTTNMIRTQIYIPQDTHKILIHLAREKKRQMAEIIREFIDKGIKSVSQKDTSGKKTLSAIMQLKFTDGANDLSSNIDHYLYGTPKDHE